MKKTIDLKDEYKPDIKPIELGNEIMPGSLFIATERFYRFLRKEKFSLNCYYFTLEQIFKMNSYGELPILLYIGERPTSLLSYRDHIFLMGAERCYLYEDDFMLCFPITITILNSPEE